MKSKIVSNNGQGGFIDIDTIDETNNIPPSVAKYKTLINLFSACTSP